MNTAPTLLDAAERLGRVRCAIEAFGCGCDPEVGHVCEVCSTLGAIGEPCGHERKLAEYKAAVEPILCDAVESADPAGLLRAADMVPAQALREAVEETDAEARACTGVAVAALMAHIARRFRALLPENQERTPPAPKPSPTLFECQCCDRTTWGLSDGSTDEEGWRWIARMDGPNAICPVCAETPDASLATIREDWPDAYVAVARRQERTP